jgi:MT0933-like antitoxin protein
MGFLDKLKLKANEVKEKAVEAVDEHGPQIKGGIEKAGTFVDKKTKGKYSDKIAKGTQKAGEAVEGARKPAAGQPVPPPAPPTGHTPESHPHPHNAPPPPSAPEPPSAAEPPASPMQSSAPQPPSAPQPQDTPPPAP